MPPQEAPDPVILYDGECGLCNRVVRGLMRWDKDGRLRYTPLQDRPAQKFLKDRGEPPNDLSTVYFVADWAQRERSEYLTHSDAVIAALEVCGGAAGVFGRLVKVVPHAWRDAGYTAVGHMRYRIFGPWKDRPLPRAEWADRIFH